VNRHLADARTWLIGGAVVALLVVAVGWLLLIEPERSTTSDLQDQTAQSQQQNALLRIKVATLKAKSAKADQYAAVLVQAQAALPSDSGLPTFTRQLDADADGAGVHLSSLVVSGVTPVVAGGTAAAPTTTDTTTSVAGQLFSVRVTVTTKGSLSSQLAFLRALRSGPRRALVNGAQFAPAGTGTTASIETSSTLTTDVTVFSAPQTPQQFRQVRQLLAALRG
jgi:type II secretory pathway component PulM